MGFHQSGVPQTRDLPERARDFSSLKLRGCKCLATKCCFPGLKKDFDGKGTWSPSHYTGARAKKPSAGHTNFQSLFMCEYTCFTVEMGVGCCRSLNHQTVADLCWLLLPPYCPRLNQRDHSCTTNPQPARIERSILTSLRHLKMEDCQSELPALLIDPEG